MLRASLLCKSYKAKPQKQSHLFAFLLNAAFCSFTQNGLNLMTVATLQPAGHFLLASRDRCVKHSGKKGSPEQDARAAGPVSPLPGAPLFGQQRLRRHDRGWENTWNKVISLDDSNVIAETSHKFHWLQDSKNLLTAHLNLNNRH